MTGEDLLSHHDTGRVVRRKVEIDTGAELYHADTFPFFAHIAWLRIADDAPGYEARDLHHDEVPVIGLQGIGAAFVIPGGFVQGRVEEFAGVIADVFDVGIDRHPVHVHVKKIHEDADAGEALPCERFVGLLDAHDSAVGRTKGAVSLLRADTFGITEKWLDSQSTSRKAKAGSQSPRRANRSALNATRARKGQPSLHMPVWGCFMSMSPGGGLHTRAGRPPAVRLHE